MFVGPLLHEATLLHAVNGQPFLVCFTGLAESVFSAGYIFLTVHDVDSLVAVVEAGSVGTVSDAIVAGSIHDTLYSGLRSVIFI